MNIRQLLFGLFLSPTAAHAAGLTLGPHFEVIHPNPGHEVQISGAAVAVRQDGEVLIAWARQAGQTNNLYLARPSAEGEQPVRVNPDDMAVDSLHQPPGLAVGPKGEVYVSWSSIKPKPEGALFASDLRLSRSLGGKENVNE